MNFFGHAVVAAWSDNRAGHLLGSMLPDFETMVRVPLVRVRDPDVERGIDFHHRTDQAFHRAPTFIQLCAKAFDEMIGRGVRRGTSRAAAHVGTELFLDGWLARDPVHVAHYLAALQIDPSNRLEWEDQGAAFQRLHARLAAWGAPTGYDQPGFVLARLADSLRTRPALAPQDGELRLLADQLPSLQQTVERRAPELLQEIRNGLGFGR